MGGFGWLWLVLGGCWWLPVILGGCMFYNYGFMMPSAEIHNQIINQKQLCRFNHQIADLSLLYNFNQLSLNSGSVQVQTLLAVCQRFAMVRISDNGSSWK